MTEKTLQKVWRFQKESLSLRLKSAFTDFRHTESEAPCFILTNGNLRNSLSITKGQTEGWGCCTVVSTLMGVDFCHIPPSRFSQDLRCRISARSLRLSVNNN
jgi:hypothetical protein